jgi:hypothetical protein
MTTIPSPDEDIALTDDERFIDILIANEDLLLAEFNSIVLEEWPDPESDHPDDAVSRSARPRRDPPPTPSATPRACDEECTHSSPAVASWARQRSPPGARARRCPPASTGTPYYLTVQESLGGMWVTMPSAAGVIVGNSQPITFK